MGNAFNVMDSGLCSLLQVSYHLFACVKLIYPRNIKFKKMLGRADFEGRAGTLNNSFFFTWPYMVYSVVWTLVFGSPQLLPSGV